MKIVRKNTLMRNAEGILTIIAVIVFTSKATAQSGLKSIFKVTDEINLTVGPSLFLPSQYFKPIKEVREITPGIDLKLALFHKLSNRFKLGIGVSWDKFNYRNSIDNSSANGVRIATGELKNEYLTGSIVVQYHIGRSQQLRISAGPYFSRLTNSRTTETMKDAVNGIYYYKSGDTSSLYRSFDGGLECTLSYPIKLTTYYSLIFCLQGKSGLVDISNNQLPQIISLKRNNTISLLLGIII